MYDERDDRPPPGWEPPALDVPTLELDYQDAFNAYVTTWPGDVGHGRAYSRYVAAFDALARARRRQDAHGVDQPRPRADEVVT